jgi:predicted MFS family arabinose efflux permease
LEVAGAQYGGTFNIGIAAGAWVAGCSTDRDELQGNLWGVVALALAALIMRLGARQPRKCSSAE